KIKFRSYFDQAQPQVQYLSLSSSISSSLTSPLAATHSLANINQLVMNSNFGIIVIGSLCGQENIDLIKQIINYLQWPVFYDISSSLKHDGYHPHDWVLWDWDHPYQQ